MSQLNNNKKNKTFILAVSSICLALCVVFLYFSTFSVGIDSVLTLVAGFLVFFITKSFGLKWGIVFFVAATILSLLVVSAKIELSFFILCFGPFALIHAKLYSYKKISKIVRVVVAIVIMTALTALIGFLFIGLTVTDIDAPLFNDFARDNLQIYLLGYGIVSGIVCYVVYDPLAQIFLSRLPENRPGRRAGAKPSAIVLPKMYKGDDEVKKGDDDDSTVD